MLFAPPPTPPPYFTERDRAQDRARVAALTDEAKSLMTELARMEDAVGNYRAQIDSSIRDEYETQQTLAVKSAELAAARSAAEAETSRLRAAVEEAVAEAEAGAPPSISLSSFSLFEIDVHKGGGSV